MLQVSLVIIVVLLVVYIIYLQTKVRNLKVELSKFLVTNVDFKLDQEIYEMLRDGKTMVEIVKLVRQRTNLDLLQAKLYVDRVLQNNGS